MSFNISLGHSRSFEMTLMRWALSPYCYFVVTMRSRTISEIFSFK